MRCHAGSAEGTKSLWNKLIGRGLCQLAFPDGAAACGDPYMKTVCPGKNEQSCQSFLSYSFLYRFCAGRRQFSTRDCEACIGLGICVENTCGCVSWYVFVGDADGVMNKADVDCCRKCIALSEILLLELCTCILYA